MAQNTETRFKIEAQIDQAAARRAGLVNAAGYVNTDGYSIYDYFAIPLDAIWPTREDAQKAAEVGYIGPDVDGVGCTWQIVEVDAASYESTGN